MDREKIKRREERHADADKLVVICELADDYEPDDRHPLPFFLKRRDDPVRTEGFWAKLKKRIFNTPVP